jgi:predicted RecB family nuclease
MKLTSDLFADFLKCPTKCYLHSTGQAGTGNAYAEWVREQNDAYRADAAKGLIAGLPEADAVLAPSAAGNLKTATWRLAVDLPVQAGDMESRLQAVERVPSEGRGRPAQFNPVRFVFFNKLTKEDRLLLAFDALGLSEVLGREVSAGKIIHGDDHVVLKVKVASLMGTVRKITGKIPVLLARGSPPDLILKRHCGECEFRERCRQQAAETDELTLLAGLTEKQRTSYRAKGIFTLTQLSYTFRPRRTPKRTKNPAKPHHYALQALAIREKTVYIHGTPVLPRGNVEVYFDIEGLPDRDFYYLLGALVISEGQESFHPYWADSESDQESIFSQFADMVYQLPGSQLFHFGDYDALAIKRVASLCSDGRRGTLEAIGNRCVNVLSVVYPHVYFPTYSNGLKEVGKYLEPSASETTGLQTVIWRTKWESTRDQHFKDSLIDYNRMDCVLLKRLIDFVTHHTAEDVPAGQGSVAVGHTERLQRGRQRWCMFTRKDYALEEFRHIVRCGYFDYQREKVMVRTNRYLKKVNRRRNERKVDILPPNKIINFRRARCCDCGSPRLEQDEGNRRMCVDLRFSKAIVRRWVTRFQSFRYRCTRCGHEFTSESQFPDNTKKYGLGLVSWVMYLNVIRGVNMLAVQKTLNDLFGISIRNGQLYKFKEDFQTVYKSLSEEILGQIVKGAVLHIDETVVNLRKEKGYVWVVASMDMVYFFYRPTREASFLVEMLRDFSGVLVSDFFTGYDSFSCPQQKCLVHLVREIDEDLVHNPFDDDFKLLAQGFGSLIRPIIDTVDRYGLKKRHLGKHKRDVDRFLQKLDSVEPASELTKKYRKRFLKYWAKMFTFLDHDGVPWNNTNAEHAIKRIAKYRRSSDGCYTEKTLKEYFVLASVLETCELNGVNVLQFLLSKEDSLAGLLRMAGREPEGAGKRGQ